MLPTHVHRNIFDMEPQSLDTVHQNTPKQMAKTTTNNNGNEDDENDNRYIYMAKEKI